MRVIYRHEYARRLRAGFIGAGGHSYRNIYPTFAYVPVDLVAVCDRVEERARVAAAQFGAARVYTDHRAMLEREDLEVVFVVVGYDPQTGSPLYPPLAMDVMRAGCDCWIEKPPAATVAEIDAMREVERETGRFTMVGVKKCFFPAVEKVKEICGLPEFGGIQSATLRYPQYIPTVAEMAEGPRNPRTRSFLDHLVHPTSILHYLLGMPTAFTYTRSENGSGVALYTFASGATAALHLSAGQSGLGA
ncbi:MAG: Gfo/Idh/MocA family oxidoreductase, partial [Armatimonadota bacterium]|nr:Gfo/Idh/MocA family oxidoreductase [Armatimonadota bacterium]